MQTAHLSMGLADELNRLNRRFFGVTTNIIQECTQLLRVVFVMPRMKGLGLKDLKHMNYALLAKLIWRMIFSPESLWARLLWKKYGSPLENRNGTPEYHRL